MINKPRNVKTYQTQSYDLIIAGGGIYGIMLAYEAVRKHLKPLLLEKHDFNYATSLNHLRTVHGGLRYLQSLDLPRFMESVSERKWFLQYFPQYVQVMPCLMPLYGKGLHRNFILFGGLLLNDILSFNRNSGVVPDRHLPNGRIITSEETRDIFPMVEYQGLTGGAVWYDGSIAEYQRLTTELLKRSVENGATALNYVEVRQIIKESNQVVGVQAVDTESGEELEFKSRVVINATGPWCRDMAKCFADDHEPLFKKRLRLWNVLFNRPALSSHALGISTVKGGGHTYFFHPWKNRLLVGTGEVVVEKSATETAVPQPDMTHFVDDLNQIVPGLDLSVSHVQRIYAGILPAKDNGQLANREVIFNHASAGGPQGLYSISGVKFTTSRLVAEKVLQGIFPNTQKQTHEELLKTVNDNAIIFSYDWKPQTEADLSVLKGIVDTEWVVHLSDLMMRRTSLADHPERALDILSQIRSLFDWDDHQWNQEVVLLKSQLKSTGSV